MKSITVATNTAPSDNLPKYHSASKRVRGFLSLGHRTNVSETGRSLESKQPVTITRNRSNTSSTDSPSDANIVTYLTQREQSRQERRQGGPDRPAIKNFGVERENAGSDTFSRKHKLFKRRGYAPPTEVGKPISKQMISAPLAAKSSLGHERLSLRSLAEAEWGRDIQHFSHLPSPRATMGAQYLRDETQHSRPSSFRTSSTSSVFSSPRTGSPFRHALNASGGHKKSGSFSRLCSYMGTSADALDATRRDLNRSVNRLGSYISTSADVLDATRRGVATNIRKSTEKAFSAVRSPFDQSEYESGSDSDESFFCVGEGGKLLDMQQSDENEPSILRDEVEPLSLRTIKDTPMAAFRSQVHTPTIFSDPFYDKHEISEVPITGRILHGREVKPIFATSVSTYHHVDSEDEEASRPVSPLTPVSPPSPRLGPLSHISPQRPEGATRYASSYERWQMAELCAEYKEFEKTRPEILLSGSRGGDSNDSPSTWPGLVAAFGSSGVAKPPGIRRRNGDGYYLSGVDQPLR